MKTALVGALAACCVAAIALAGVNAPYLSKSGDRAAGRIGSLVASDVAGFSVPQGRCITLDQPGPWGCTSSSANLLYDGTSVVLRNGATTNITMDATAGGISVIGAVVSTRAGAVAFRADSTGWFDMVGDTAANIATRVPCTGCGGLIYDDTNTKIRLYENGAWTFALTAATNATALTSATSGECSASLDFPDTAPDTCSNLTMTCTGAATGDPVACIIPSTGIAAMGHICYVSAADTLTVRVCNNAPTGNVNLAAATFGARYF